MTTDSSGNVIPIVTDGNTTDGSNDFGGRIVRVLPDGTLNTFAYGFDTNGARIPQLRQLDAEHQFLGGWHDPLASDDQGIWQFKTTADLAELDKRHAGRLERPPHAGRTLRWSEQRVEVVDTGVEPRRLLPGPSRSGHQHLHRRPGQLDLAASTSATTDAPAVEEAAAPAAARRRQTYWPIQSTATERRSRA